MIGSLRHESSPWSTRRRRGKSSGGCAEQDEAGTEAEMDVKRFSDGVWVVHHGIDSYVLLLLLLLLPQSVDVVRWKPQTRGPKPEIGRPLHYHYLKFVLFVLTVSEHHIVVSHPADCFETRSRLKSPLIVRRLVNSRLSTSTLHPPPLAFVLSVCLDWRRSSTSRHLLRTRTQLCDTRA